jgi:hypothetical protein
MIDTNLSRPDRGVALCALSFALLCLLFLAPAPASASSATVYVEGVPGGVIMHTEEVAAKVIEIDHAKRTATLQSADGETFAAKVGEGAVNFDQVAVGDMVNVTLTEELVVFLDEEGAAPIDSSSSALATAPQGAQPGGLVVATNQVTGTVTAIDLEQRTATLQFKDGSTKTLPVRDDIDLTLRKVGDQVVFRLTEKLAISVEKP